MDDQKEGLGSTRFDRANRGPQPVLGYFDSIALIVGIVVGAGIFSVPALVAASSASWQTFLLVWVIGGFVSLIGVPESTRRHHRAQ